MSTTARKTPTTFWAVEVVTTNGKKWILAKAANQGAARGRGEKLGNFVSHSQQIEITEQEYNAGRALTRATPRTKIHHR